MQFVKVPMVHLLNKQLDLSQSSLMVTSLRALAAKSVRKAKLAEIHVSQKVRPATKAKAAHATDDKDIIVTLRNISL